MTRTVKREIIENGYKITEYDLGVTTSTGGTISAEEYDAHRNRAIDCSSNDDPDNDD